LFTGIIEETGTIRSLVREPEGAVLVVEARKIAPELAQGDSVAVNGVCLTVVASTHLDFRADVSAESLRRSSLAQARQGKPVNLERALSVGSRLGGHIVQGHVDGVGALISAHPSGEGYEMEFSVPSELERYLVVKGSVAVDGISLTVATLKPGAFGVAVIPHTYSATNLGQMKPGDRVNLEGDILAKYFERFFTLGLLDSRTPRNELTVDMLKEQGF
jgi:riboflavin synthase